MGKSSPSPPPTPSAAETGAASTRTNTSTAAAQAALNDVNQVTPYGTTSYDPTGYYTTPGGDTVPRYTQTTTLDPVSQGLYEQQQRLVAGDQGLQSQAQQIQAHQQAITGSQQQLSDSLLSPAWMLGQQGAAEAQRPLNFNTNFSDTLNATPQALNSRVTDALYGQQKSFLDPAWDLKQQQLTDQLAKQGIPVGSDAYNNAMKQIDSSRTQAYQSAADSSIGQGVQAQQALFGMAQSGQNQNIQEQQLRQQQPFSLLQQVYGAMSPQAQQYSQSPSPTPQQPVTPAAQTGIAPTDMVGAQAAANNAAMGGYQARVATTNANNGAVASLATAAVTAAAIY